MPRSYSFGPVQTPVLRADAAALTKLDPVSASYRRYLLAVLLAVLAFNLVDRVAVGILLQGIKRDLVLSDTQLGFLTGIAFAMFYSVMGIPIARWADRGNRVLIIGVTTALWSVAVALCGVAESFIQLLSLRICVAVGEAGCIPPAHSLIADYFTRAERPRAVARYMLGYPLSATIGYFLAGWLNQLYGWRLTFVALGVPGLALAAFAGFTLQEPRTRRRPGVDNPASGLAASPHSVMSDSDHPTLREVSVALLSNATFRHLLLGYSIMSFFGYGITQWKPAFFMRSYGLDTGPVGIWFAVIYGVSGLLGTHWGGALASRRAARNERLQLRSIGIAYAVFGIVSAGIYLSPNPYLAFALLALSLLGIYTTYGPLFAVIQTLVCPRMRAISIAIVYLFANLVGMGLGPLAAGALSDALQPAFGDESLRYALLALSPGFAWAGWHVWWASRSVTRDLEAAQGAAGG